MLGAWVCPHPSFAALPAHRNLTHYRMRTLHLRLRQAWVGLLLWHRRGHPTSQLHPTGQTRVTNFLGRCQSAYRAHSHWKKSMTRLTHHSSLCNKPQSRSPLVSCPRRTATRMSQLMSTLCLTHPRRGSHTLRHMLTRPMSSTLPSSSEAEVCLVTGTGHSLSLAQPVRLSVRTCPSSLPSLSARARAFSVTSVGRSNAVEAW
jgi:hypothetical protein